VYWTTLSVAKTSLKRRHKDADKWRERHYINCVKGRQKGCQKGRQKGRQKDSPLLPCLIVYSLKQKRERVAHYLSVFIIVIIYFDNFDMIL
jgi:hypothetical protein